MSRGSGEGRPVSSAKESRELGLGTKPARGRSERTEAELKQQKENPAAGAVPQERASRSQQSPHEAAAATVGQSTPSRTRARRNPAR